MNEALVMIEFKVRMNSVELSDLENPQDVPQYILPEIKDALIRAGRSGARPPLEYVGAGMYGIVFCDQGGHAWKVARGDPGSPFIRESVAIEYEWLRDAAGSEIARNVSKVYDVHPEQLVLERECVRGRPGGWADDRKLHDLHEKIEKVMIPRGWSAPEFKENSYIIKPDGVAVLVDISMAMRVGMNLAGYVEDALEGRRWTHERWRDLAFSLLSEMRHKTVPEDVGRKLIDRLNERDPEIKRGFSIPW